MPLVKNPEDYTMPPPRPQRHIDDSNWIIENINELTEKYPDMWIAVLDKEVVIASKDLGKVKTVARKKARRSDADLVPTSSLRASNNFVV